MGMVLTEEQRLLKESAQSFVAEKAPVKALRELRDGKDETGFSRALWREMCEMGWAGVVIPEEHGGIGFGYQGLGIILEETGRTLTASPLVSTALIGASAILLGGSDEQMAELLPKIAAGECLTALALEEGPHHDPTRTALVAQKTGSGYRLSGRKVFVLDGHVADLLIVVARTAGKPGEEDGITLFLVSADAAGIVRTRTSMVDSRNAAIVELDDVEVPAGAVLGQVGKGFALLDSILDRARIGLAAEMLGSAQAAFDMTLDYLKTRSQFGQLIGSFQALQHRASMRFADLELTRSCIMEALSAIDERKNNLASLASLAKAWASDTFHRIAREGIQMHGGIGMTDEHDIGLYLKRAQVAEATFGTAAFHRARYAGLEGF